MNKLFSLIISLLSLLFIFTVCTDKSTGSDDPPQPGDIFGMWRDTISLAPLLPETTLVNLNIVEPDSTFKITIINSPDDTIVLHSGKWEIIGDSIYFKGEQMLVVDTTADPDTMAIMPDSLSQQVFALDTTRTPENEWKFKASSLGPIIDALPIPDLFKQFLLSYEFSFTKDPVFRDEDLI